MKIGGMLREVRKSTPGKLGLILLLTLSLASIYVVLTYPRDFGATRWGNPSVWADNPKSAPPVWTNLLSRSKRVRHAVVTFTAPTTVTSTDRANELLFDFAYDFSADEPPTLLSISIDTVTFSARPPVITTTMIRPDGGEVTLFREATRGARRGEDGPFIRHDEEPLRVVIGNDERMADDLAEIFAATYSGGDRRDIADDPVGALFGVPAESGFDMLPGDYLLRVEVLTADAEDSVGSVKLVVGGSVYGFMGTDSLGRDLAEGLLYGLPIALLIGITTATISTLLGMTLGMISGYFGGAVDLILQRAADIVANVPLLPLLIFLVFVVGSHLWLILGILVAFSWPGLTIMVRSMVLQLRTGQEVEAARALGASPFRVIFRHIFPHAASYILAQLVFFAPSAILAEAGLSFLGLGDPSIPTWGQILEYGFRTGAVFLGYWWWVIPPGLMIVLTAVTFMFLALGLEPVVDPRLRGRRLWRS